MRPVRPGEILNEGFLAGTFFTTLAKVWVLCK
jgi:plasmid maintenance system antidote protein VapI